MSGILMMVIAIVVLGGAYLLYGRYLQNKWGIDPKAKTPAYELEDGVDYVPADTNVVFGHQFASIAGASDQRTHPGSDLWLAAGYVMDPHRRCILRGSPGFCRYVRICKKQGTYHWLHH